MRRVGWADLSRPAQAWRLVHAAWSVAQLSALGWIWGSAIARRRGPGVWASVAFIGAEGVGLVIGRGNCPMGPLQEAVGDPVPFFELFLPPRAAKAAVPVLAIVSLAGIAALALRRPGLVARAGASSSGRIVVGRRDRRDRRTPVHRSFRLIARLVQGAGVGLTWR